MNLAFNWDWSWIQPTIGGALVSAVVGVAAFFLVRWFKCAGTLHFNFVGREQPTFTIRGTLDPGSRELQQDPPRFMNYRISLTIHNDRGVDLHLRIENIFFCEGEPAWDKDGGFQLPGAGQCRSVSLLALRLHRLCSSQAPHCIQTPSRTRLRARSRTVVQSP